MTMPVLQGRSFAAIPQPALSSCSVGCCGRWPDAAAGHRLPPRHPHSPALQQPPLLPLSSTRDALPLPSPPGSPVNYFSRPRFYCFALCNIWHAGTILIKDRQRAKLILRGEKIEWVCFQITSTLSNFFNCGSVRRTESMKINCQTCVCVSVCLCVCVSVYEHSATCVSVDRVPLRTGILRHHQARKFAQRSQPKHLWLMLHFPTHLKNFQIKFHWIPLTKLQSCSSWQKVPWGCNSAENVFPICKVWNSSERKLVYQIPIKRIFCDSDPMHWREPFAGK